MKKNSAVLFYSFLLVALVVALFWPITKSFYQQDEWLGYGLYLANGKGLIFQNTGGFWGTILGQGRVLTNLLYFLFYKYFPLNVFPIAIFAILFHIINTLLVFSLAKNLFKKNLPAFLGSLFFVLNSVSQSAVTWPAASINTLPSTTFILLSIVAYFKFLRKNNKKYLFYGFLAVYVSLFFKESGVFLLLLFPLMSLFFKKFSLKNFFNYFWYYFLVVLIIVIYRLSGFFLTSHENALFLTGSSKYFFDSLIVRFVLYPLTSASLAIIPAEPFLYFARHIVNVNYPFISEAQFILVAQSIVLDLLAVIATVFIGMVSYLFFKNTETRHKKYIIFWFVFLLASFLPYIVISKSYSYLESRYYYLATTAWAIIFAWFFDLLFGRVKNLLVKMVVLILFTFFVYAHATILGAGIKVLVNESQTRIDILNQFKILKPDLTGNINIFYVTGDVDFLLLGNKVPFQQGFGYTLLSFYLPSSGYPSDLLNNLELFELGKQGYFEKDGYGFGYFSDKDLLLKVIKEGGYKKNSVYGFFYDSKKKELTDISDEI